MRSIKELSAEANSYPFSAGVSFPSWIHVCQTLQREARVYDLEDDVNGIERAYILYLRMADLVLNRLPRHPSFAAYKKQYNYVCSQIPSAIDRSEALKKRLESRRPAQPHKPHVEVSEKPAVEASAPSSSSSRQQPPHSNDADVLDSMSNAASAQVDLDDSLRATLQSLKMPFRSASNFSQAQAPRPPAFEYPTIAETDRHSQPFLSPRESISSALAQPPLPEKPNEGLSHSIAAQHKSIYTTEKGEQLRPLFVPADLRARFLDIAVKNTQSNLETCGILCGKLNRNAFFITNLVVPHQTSTSDSCDMTNEEELFEYVDKRDLFIVGWIHTHPSQSCFMSSIDLHTQAGYQIMLPEAIAIVCAPRASPSWGVFRLTDPPGVDIIKNCRLTGFHPHSQSNLYKLANPGHVKEIDFSFEAVDLRDS